MRSVSYFTTTERHHQTFHAGERGVKTLEVQEHGVLVVWEYGDASLYPWHRVGLVRFGKNEPPPWE